MEINVPLLRGVTARRSGNSRAIGLALFLLAPAATGCVRMDVYDAVVYDLSVARDQAARAGQAAAMFNAEVQRLNGELARLAVELKARDARLAELGVARANDAKKMDDLMVANAELSDRLKKVGQSVEVLSGEKGSLSKALAETKARLEELRRQQAAAEARAAQFRELAARFQRLIDAGQLKVVMRNGRMVLELSNDILFDSGKTDLKEVGKKTLAEIAQVLRTMPDRRFQVAGHTDNVKIATPRFPSNWELSTARAVEVVKLLVDDGMDSRNLSAAGYGEFAPLDGNETTEGRAKNRRIEITLVPNLEEVAGVAAPPPGPAPAPR
jgi:chemotaxis protein MotB